MKFLITFIVFYNVVLVYKAKRPKMVFKGSKQNGLKCVKLVVREARGPLSVSVLNQLRVKLIQFHFKLIELNPYNMFKNAHFHIFSPNPSFTQWHQWFIIRGVIRAVICFLKGLSDVLDDVLHNSRLFKIVENHKKILKIGKMK